MQFSGDEPISRLVPAGLRMAIQRAQVNTMMITRDMFIADILRKFPQTLPIFKQFKLDCYECQIADLETLEHGASVHLLSIEDLLEALNRTVTQSHQAN